MKLLLLAVAAIALSVTSGALAFHLLSDASPAPLEGSSPAALVTGESDESLEAESEEQASCCDLEEAENSAATVVASASETSLVQIPDVWLTDQDGVKHRLHTDLIAGKSVMIQFFFTSCTTVCPILASVFRGVQDRAEERLGEDLVLLSISVDPAVDTPDRLASFAEHHGAKEGWHLLTGEPEEVRQVLTAFGVYTRKKEEHSSLAVIGHQPSGTWLYNSGFASPDSLLTLLGQVESGRSEAR